MGKIAGLASLGRDFASCHEWQPRRTRPERPFDGCSSERRLHDGHYAIPHIIPLFHHHAVLTRIAPAFLALLRREAREDPWAVEPLMGALGAGRGGGP